MIYLIKTQKINGILKFIQKKINIEYTNMVLVYIIKCKSIFRFQILTEVGESSSLLQTTKIFQNFKALKVYYHLILMSCFSLSMHLMFNH